MSLVRVVHRTPARPEICWSLMADFDNIDFFNPHIERSAHLEGSPAPGIGTERQCDLRGGRGYLRERVIAWTEGRSYTVDIFDSTLPVDGITTTLRPRAAWRGHAPVHARRAIGLAGESLVPPPMSCCSVRSSRTIWRA